MGLAPTNYTDHNGSAAVHLELHIINPRRMREGYGSRSVCVSVTVLAATYLFYTSKIRCH